MDYVIIPHDMLQSISDFNIETCQSFMSRNHLESLLHETSKIPDHAIVTVTVGIISHRRVFLNEPTADHPGDTNYAGQDETRF